MEPARLMLLRDGPYEVTGPLDVLAEDGRTIQAPAPTVHRCRCGRSATKPFCDGSHARTERTEEA